MKLNHVFQGLRLRYITAAFSFLCFHAVAQDTAPTPAEKPKKSASSTSKNKTKQETIDFEDELIHGDVNKPELFYMLQKKEFNFKRLIKLREDFLPEMRQTAPEVQRSKGT